MNIHRLISVISDDKPGIVDAIAEKIAEVEGSWLESRLSKLAGKFAGVIRVAIDETQADALDSSLASLTERGIWIKSEPIAGSTSRAQDLKIAYVHLLGPDRPGIVRELSKALLKNQINVANLETSISSMPYSGDPLFEASGELEIPADVDLQEFHDTLNSIGDALALDIELSEHPIDAP